MRLPLNKLSLLKAISKASRKLGPGRESAPALSFTVPRDVVARQRRGPPLELLELFLVLLLRAPRVALVEHRVRAPAAGRP